MFTKLVVLLDLQKIDSRLKELEALRGDLPQKVGQTRNHISDLISNLDTQKQGLKANALERNQLVVEMENAENKLKRYQEQLYRVSTNREYDAITMEIETVRSTINQLELRILKLDEEKTNLEKGIVDLETQKTTQSSNFEALEKELQEKLSITNREEENLRLQRQHLVSKIDRQMYNTYERVRKAKSGQAVVALQRNACGGCFNAIPPQRLMEIREKKTFITCEFCGRILIWDENQNNF